MKKTVILASLIKAKNDLELFIKVDQMDRLKKLFDPLFDIKDLNSKIEAKENQLIIIKEAIQNANTNTVDSEGKSLNYSIYLLSKYNRWKSDLLTMQQKVDNNDWFESNNEKLKKSLLKDIQELDELIKNTEDKKKKSEHLTAKAKLKRSLTKTSLTSNAHTDKLKKQFHEDLKKVEEQIIILKDKLTEYNGKTTVDVEIAEGFEIIIK